MNAGVPQPILERIDAYLDQAPRSTARTEQLGPFTLFIGDPNANSWSYYARPTLPPADSFRPADVVAVMRRQAELGVPQAVEAIMETAPGLGRACAEAGLVVHELPLLVHHDPVAVPVPDGIRIRRLDPADPAIAASRVVADLGFTLPGTERGATGPQERDDVLGQRDPAADDRRRARMAAGQLVVVVAEDEHGVLACGAHQPVGMTTEIVGVATLPSARRGGLGAAVTDTLVADAFRRGITMVMLSAGGDEVARVYKRVGFRQVATALAAEPL